MPLGKIQRAPLGTFKRAPTKGFNGSLLISKLSINT
jgi:hypothetical protein